MSILPLNPKQLRIGIEHTPPERLVELLPELMARFALLIERADVRLDELERKEHECHCRKHN